MKDIGASIRARLLNHSNASRQSFNAVLEQYVAGRFLARLSHSAYREQYILKGAQLFRIWQPDLHRPTRDVDLLGIGDPSEEALQAAFNTICQSTGGTDDGLSWGEVKITPIRDDMDYGGLRVRVEANLAGAKIPLQIDVGFGDAVTPKPVRANWLSILEFPAASILIYPPETVIAEKTEATIRLGLANSRMKDFFDLNWLSQNMEFDAALLAKAIHATFERRRTPIPQSTPEALSEDFSKDQIKNTQWNAFIKKGGLEEVAFSEVITHLNEFLLPLLLDSTAAQEKRQWNALTGWTKTA